MAEFVCRLGTPAGEIVTRTIEASAVHEARARLEREGFKVFNITPPKAEGLTSFTKVSGGSGRTKVKANDFLLFNQQLAALLRAGIPILQAIAMLRRRATSVRSTGPRFFRFVRIYPDCSATGPRRRTWRKTLLSGFSRR